MTTFRIENLNNRIQLSEVTYWTDRDICDKKTVPFTGFVNVHVEPYKK